MGDRPTSFEEVLENFSSYTNKRRDNCFVWLTEHVYTAAELYGRQDVTFRFGWDYRREDGKNQGVVQGQHYKDKVVTSFEPMSAGHFGKRFWSPYIKGITFQTLLKVCKDDHATHQSYHDRVERVLRMCVDNNLTAALGRVYLGNGNFTHYATHGIDPGLL